MTFASPDFGAGGIVVLVVLVVCLIVLGLSLLGIIRGVRLLKRESFASKLKGVLLALAFALLPVTVYYAPGYLFRMEYGRQPLGHYPNGVVMDGMSADEVRALLGEPHKISESGHRVSWTYYLDPIELDWFKVYFGPDGRVTSTGGS